MLAYSTINLVASLCRDKHSFFESTKYVTGSLGDVEWILCHKPYLISYNV